MMPEDLSLLSSVPLCCLPWTEQDGMLQGRREAEMWGRSVCAERGPREAQTWQGKKSTRQTNGRKAREKHRRQKVFLKIKKKKESE